MFALAPLAGRSDRVGHVPWRIGNPSAGMTVGPMVRAWRREPTRTGFTLEHSSQCGLENHRRRRSPRLMRRRSGGLLRRSGQPATFQSRLHRSQRQLRTGPSADMTRVAWTSVMDPQVGQRTPWAMPLTTKDQVQRSQSVDGDMLEPHCGRRGTRWPLRRLTAG